MPHRWNKSFPSESVAISQDNTIDTGGTGIEQDLMQLIEGNRIPSPSSPTSFIDSEFEDTNEFF